MPWGTPRGTGMTQPRKLAVGSVWLEVPQHRPEEHWLAACSAAAGCAFCTTLPCSNSASSAVGYWQQPGLQHAARMQGLNEQCSALLHSRLQADARSETGFQRRCCCCSSIAGPGAAISQKQEPAAAC